MSPSPRKNEKENNKIFHYTQVCTCTYTCNMIYCIAYMLGTYAPMLDRSGRPRGGAGSLV